MKLIRPEVSPMKYTSIEIKTVAFYDLSRSIILEQSLEVFVSVLGPNYFTGFTLGLLNMFD